MGSRKLLAFSLLAVLFIAVVLAIGMYLTLVRPSKGGVPQSSCLLQGLAFADENSGEKCAECHSNSLPFKEWQNSAHANSLRTIQKEPKAGTVCIKCHSADYNRYAGVAAWGARVNLPKPKEAKDPVSCSSCHKHDSGLAHNLVMPPDKLCISCHKFDCG